MMTEITWQDYEAAADKHKLLLDAITRYKLSPMIQPDEIAGIMERLAQEA